MTEAELNRKYFEWMLHLISDNRFKKPSYRKLLAHLHKIEFAYTISLDGNRAEDGIDLRYRFGRYYGCDDRIVASYLDNQPCSVLEMMIALAVRCEDSIMDNSDLGDRTGQWFWEMIVSLGLGSMTDDKFSIEYVDDVIAKFLNREYERNGHGGLFTVDKGNRDLRSVEIWYQMCWYLDDLV